MSTCSKIGHATRKLANGQRTHVSKKSSEFNVYRCERCGLWHVGRNRKPFRHRRSAPRGGRAFL